MLVYFSLVLTVLLGFVGLAVDVGRMELGTIQLQAIADDAVMTAAAELQNGNSNWQTLGGLEATSAAAATGLASVSSVFKIQASTGPYASDYSAIQATVTQSMPIYFLSLITGSKSKTLSATAVAATQPCSYFTNSLTYSLYLASAGVYATCSIYAQNAIGVDGFGNLNVPQAKVTGRQPLSTVVGSTRTTPIYSAPVLPDPLGYITPPVFHSCTAGDSNLTIINPTNLYPGTYCGGLAIKSTCVTLSPGLYIITGGFSLTQGATITGTGVTLYFTQGGGSGFGTVTFGNGVGGWVNAYLTAPTDSSAGGIPAVVLYTDPAWTGSGTISFSSCYWQGDGIFYSKTAPVSLWASSMDHGTYFGMDVPYLYDYGTDLHLIPNYAALPGGNPFHIAATLVQ